jgi:hypothetical protein
MYIGFLCGVTGVLCNLHKILCGFPGERSEPGKKYNKTKKKYHNNPYYTIPFWHRNSEDIIKVKEK